MRGLMARVQKALAPALLAVPFLLFPGKSTPQLQFNPLVNNAPDC